MDRLLRTVGRRPGRRAAGAPLRLLALAAAAVIAHAACARSAAAPPVVNTFDSPERLAAAVADALERRDADRLHSLALTEEEFRAHVWPQLPASRPEHGVPFGLAWGQLSTKSRAYLRQTLAGHGGRRLTVTGVRFREEATDYGAFRVHRQSEVLVRDPSGAERPLRLFGSILERDGRYKLFSYVVD